MNRMSLGYFYNEKSSMFLENSAPLNSPKDEFVDLSLNREFVTKPTTDTSFALHNDVSSNQINELSPNLYVGNLKDYQWPLTSKKPKDYFVQEQFAAFIGCTLFHRRFPALCRRPIGSLERHYLLREGILDESLKEKNYGNLTAIDADEAIFVMQSHFPEQYAQYRTYWLEESEKIRIRNYENFRPDFMKLNSVEDEKLTLAQHKRSYNLVDKIEIFNQRLNEQRKRNSSSLDLQTMIVHVPRTQTELREFGQNLSCDYLRFPVAIEVGQFQSACPKYKSEDLQYLPLNTTGQERLVGPVHSQMFEDPEFEESDDEIIDCNVENRNGFIAPEKKTVRSTRFGLTNFLSGDCNGSLRVCKICLSGEGLNKFSMPERLLRCKTCSYLFHLTCDGFRRSTNIASLYSSDWQCENCITCSICRALILSTEPSTDHEAVENEEIAALRCANCDKMFHVSCLPELKISTRQMPMAPIGRWVCSTCGKCASCLKVSSADWKPEFTTPADPDKSPKFLQNHCSICSTKFRKGSFCAVCLKVFEYPGGGNVADSTLYCSTCWRVVHTACDPRMPKENLASLCRTNMYTCVLCRNEVPDILK